MSNQLDGLEPKDVIKKVTGKITKLFPEKQHEGNYGPYTIQNGEIEEILWIRSKQRSDRSYPSGRTLSPILPREGQLPCHRLAASMA